MDLGTLISAATGIALAGAALGLLPSVRQIRADLRNQAIKEDRRDRAADIVLGTADQPGLDKRFERAALQLEKIVSEVSPNGGKSMADAVRTLTDRFDELKEAFSEHVGEDREARRNLWKAIRDDRRRREE